MKTTLFTDLPLGRELQQALREAEHVTPTPIQAAAIPVILSGRDLLGCAQTGTGKTAAFALPLLEQLRRTPGKTVPKAPLALVLVPTRELAVQVMESFRRYGRHLKLWATAIYGGVNQNSQVTALRRGVHVLVATPGRLIDLLQQGHARLDHVRTLILDEADRMLDMGFLPPLKQIIGKLPQERQSLCFSATMPREIADLVHSLLRDPQRIDVAPPSTTTVQVEQQVLQIDQAGKRELLREIVAAGDADRVLVFTRTKRRADVVARQLQQADIAADAIHGDKSQNARMRALDRFKTGRTHVLVATDVAARGIDVEGISHVINYDLPHDPESYVHRIGRTGRASAVGKAITFCDPSERALLRAIERLIGRDLLPREERRRQDKHRDGSAQTPAPAASGRTPGHARAQGTAGPHARPAARPAQPAAASKSRRESHRPKQRAARPQAQAHAEAQARLPSQSKSHTESQAAVTAGQRRQSHASSQRHVPVQSREFSGGSDVVGPRPARRRFRNGKPGQRSTPPARRTGKASRAGHGHNGRRGSGGAPSQH